ncbi:MAG: ACT domain-containing protein [Planctomycetaceae bacterium]
MKETKHNILLLPETYAVCRLEKKAPIPKWGIKGGLSSITRTEEELSVVCLEKQIPRAVKKEGGWRVLKVEGPLDFSLTGLLASLTAPLAREGISLFALSTYDTDYLLVKEGKLEKAIQGLREEGYEVEEGYRGQGAGGRGKKRV